MKAGLLTYGFNQDADSGSTAVTFTGNDGPKARNYLP